MLRFTKEGDTLKYGFNIYRPTDKGSIGFKLKYSKNKIFYFRYSKLRRKFFIRNIIVNLDEIKKFEQESGIT